MPTDPQKGTEHKPSYVPPSEEALAEIREVLEHVGLADEFDQLSDLPDSISKNALGKSKSAPSQRRIDQAVGYLREKQAEESGTSPAKTDTSPGEEPTIENSDDNSQRSKAIIFGSALTTLVFVLIPITQYMASSPKKSDDPGQQTFVMPAPEPPPPEKPPPPPPPPKEKLEEKEPEPPKLSLADIELSLNIGAGGEISGDFGMPGLDLSQESLGSVDIFDIADLDAPPRVLVQTPPQYPPNMRIAKIEGRVFLKFIVDETGRVTKPRVIESPHEDLGRAAVQAVLKWKFEPPLKNGQRVKARMGIAMPFKL